MPTPFAARQLVSHGHVKVNGRRVTIASYQVKEGDTIELAPKAKEMALVLEASKSAERDMPDYIEADHGKMTAKLLRTPKLARRAVRRADAAASDRGILFALIYSGFANIAEAASDRGLLLVRFNAYLPD